MQNCFRRAHSTAVGVSFFNHNGLWSHSPRLSFPNHLRLSGPQNNLPPLAAFRPAEHLSPSRLLNVYFQFSKPHLTALVVLTAMSGVALSPSPTTLPVLLSTALGTALCSASANTLNQLQEVPFDAQMARTRSRPLVRRAVTPLHAAGFAAVTGIAGPVLLWTMTSPVTAILGLSNIALYAGAYTWMKRKSTFNTWVGALVGVLPPLMGWAACDSQALLSSFSHLTSDMLQPLSLGMLLFSWQFPHFNAISHLVRGSYSQAGYQMLSVLNPPHNALVALRHALLLVPICSVLVPLSGLTTWMFAVTSLLPNVVCVRAAWKFWRKGGESDARAVFKHSLWYMPVILALMMVHKEGTDWFAWISSLIPMGEYRDEENRVDNKGKS